MNRGCSAESFKASRSRFTALFRLWSKSTNVSSVHNRLFNSSRVTSSPGRFKRVTSTWKGCPGRIALLPLLLSSAVSRLSSNSPKHTLREKCAATDITRRPKQQWREFTTLASFTKQGLCQKELKSHTE